VSRATTYSRLAKVAVAVAVIGAGGCGGEGSNARANSAGDVKSTTGKGVTASDFSARDLNGKSVRLANYLGREAVLLNFWETWCEPCVAEFPHLRRMYETNKDKGFVLLGVAMDGPETVANVPAFVKRNQLNFPVVLDEDSQIAALYNPKKSAPLSVLIDKTGTITVIREGYNPGDEVYLAREVEKVLDGGGPAK
jgi:peroxiredoxin